MRTFQIFVLVLCILFTLTLAGCALLNKTFPSQLDASGNPIPGTHQASSQQQAAAGLLPYGMGSIALNGLLLVMNGFEKYKAAKIGKGLKATVSAIKQIKDDPALKAQWDLIQSILSGAHNAAGVTPLIKSYIAKI